MSDRKEYPNVIVAGLWETRNGHLTSMPIDAKGYDTLTAIYEQGGKFLIRKRSAESISTSKNPDNAPTYYLEFVPATEVEAFNNKKMQNAPRAGL